jgi:hypothetical protein
MSKKSRNKSKCTTPVSSNTSDSASATFTDSDSESSYEEALLSSIRMITSKPRLPKQSTNRPSISPNVSSNSSGGSGQTTKPTESRIEFIKHLLDGNRLRPMIDLEAGADNADPRYERLIKKTINVRELFDSMSVTLKYIKSGTTGHTFKATSTLDRNIAFAVKVCAYPKTDDYGTIKNPKRPENTELIMLKLLSSFVLKKKSPHFILPIGTFNTSIGPFIKVPKKLIDLSDEKNESYRKFIERYDNDEFEDLVSVLISEWADGGDLLDYIRKNYESINLEKWTVIIFQILYTLASLHLKYETFRHNDMKANNILVKLTDSNYPEKLYSYMMKGIKAQIPNVKFEIPDIGIQIKIWDFDFACISGIIENNKVNADWTKKMNVSNKKNQYYDMHYFFNTLICKRFFPQFYTGGAPKEIIEFVHRIIPKQYRSVVANDYIRKGGRILVDHEYTTPYKVIMTDKLFDRYRILDIK